MGIFFLISGFVIPFSLQKAGASSFLIARALRILPTFWAALALEYLVVHLSGRFWPRVPPFGWFDYLLNGLLVDTATGYPAVDWVSWTLSVEMEFYLLAAIFRTPMLRWPLGFPLLFAAAAALLNTASGAGLLHLPATLVGETIYIAFMLVGGMFHSHFRGGLSTRNLIFGILVVMSAVLLCWWKGPLAGEFQGRSRSLLAALLVFSVCYVGRARFRPLWILDGMAAISYPLYLVHAVVGFTLVTFASDAWHMPYWLSAPSALAFSMVVAYGLHALVERPTQNLAHRYARRRVMPLTEAEQAVAS